MILAILGSFDAVESVVLRSGKIQRNPTLTDREIWESGHKCEGIVLDRDPGEACRAAFAYLLDWRYL